MYWKLNFINCFNLFFIGLFQSHKSCYGFDDSSRFLSYFFISTFNIKFIDNWVLWYVLIYFYKVITILLFKSLIWLINLSWFETI